MSKEKKERKVVWMLLIGVMVLGGTLVYPLINSKYRTKFSIQDKVRVTTGFYRGCVGHVETYTRGRNGNDHKYFVRTNDCGHGKMKGFSFLARVYEPQMKLEE